MVKPVLHTYSGEYSKITYASDGHKVSVTIETPHLIMRSVQRTGEDRRHYTTLFADPSVVNMFATGATKTPEEVALLINDRWGKRWEEENDPFSALAVFLKCLEKSTEEKRGDTASPLKFVGHAILGHGDSAGQAELAGLGHREFWKKGYGTEAALAIIKDYAWVLREEGAFLEGKLLQTIVASTREDNVAAGLILEKAGMKLTSVEVRHGAPRRIYTLELPPAAQPSSEKTARTAFAALSVTGKEDDPNKKSD